MSVRIEFYNELKRIGVDAGVAQRFMDAQPPSVAELATKDDLRVAVAELKSDLTWRIFGMFTALGAVLTAAVQYLKSARGAPRPPASDALRSRVQS